MKSSVLPAILLFIWIIQTFVSAAPPGTSDANRKVKAALNTEEMKKDVEKFANINRSDGRRFHVHEITEARNINNPKERSSIIYMKGSVGSRENPPTNMYMKIKYRDGDKNLEKTKIYRHKF